MHAYRRLCLRIRLGTLALALVAGPALADDYAPVTALMRAGQLAEAMTRVQQYLATKPRDPQMRFLKGLIEQDSGKTADAIATYTRLTEDYPELPEPHNNVAVLYAAQGQYDRARMALEIAIRNNNAYAIAHENLGDVYARLASQAYAQSQRLDASNTSLAPKLALLRQMFSVPGPGREAPPTDKARPPTPGAARLPRTEHCLEPFRIQRGPGAQSWRKGQGCQDAR